MKFHLTQTRYLFFILLVKPFKQSFFGPIVKQATCGEVKSKHLLDNIKSYISYFFIHT